MGCSPSNVIDLPIDYPHGKVDIFGPPSALSDGTPLPIWWFSGRVWVIVFSCLGSNSGTCWFAGAQIVGVPECFRSIGWAKSWLHDTLHPHPWFCWESFCLHRSTHLLRKKKKPTVGKARCHVTLDPWTTSVFDGFSALPFSAVSAFSSSPWVGKNDATKTVLDMAKVLMVMNDGD